VTAAAPSDANLAQADTGEILRSTGARVETGFWATLNDLLLHIPNMIGFVLAIAAAWLLGRLLGARLSRQLARRGKTDLGRLLGSSLTWLIVLVGALFALTVLFPGINTKNVLSLLGVGSIAVGFAFKDIFQNLVAGVILLIREPYKQGDEVCVDGFEGIVEEVETRATHIRTMDRRLVIIPNVRIFTEAITVNTACAFRMTNYRLSIAYGGDPGRAMDIVLQAIRGAEGVLAEPAAAVAIDALNDYSIDLFIVYAAPAPYVEQIRTKGAVLLAIHDACRAHGIALPFPTQVNLIHPDGAAPDHPDKLAGVPPLRGA
jgi:small conductance mechanosensitive channel